MKHRDILALMDGIAPGIAASFAKAIAPVLERLAAAEARVAELENAPDLDAIIVAAVDKAMAGQPNVADLVAAAVKDLPPTQTSLEIDADKLKAAVDEAVAGIKIDPDELARVVDASVAEHVRALPPAEPGKSVTIDEVRPLVDEAVGAAFATLRVPEDGKDADPEETRALVVAEVEKAMVAQPKVPTAEEVAALIPAPVPGKDADPEATAALVATEVERAVAALPPARDGKDADAETVMALVNEAVAKAIDALPKPENGKDAMPEAIAGAVEKALEAWPRPQDGKSVTLDELRPVIAEAVDKAMAAWPAPKDGVGLAGALKDHEGSLVLTLTDGTIVKLGRIDGEPGKDGLGFDDLEVVDGATAFTLRFVRGDKVKEWALAKPTLADCYRGVWREGAFKRGDAVTWGGSLWIAQADTEAKPETNDDWKLAVKRGRDGKDLTPAEPKALTPVKLK